MDLQFVDIDVWSGISLFNIHNVKHSLEF